MSLLRTLKDIPVVFLDFNGVLNMIGTIEETDFTPESIAALNALYSSIPYAIVLTTSWKEAYLFSDLADLLHEKGVLAPVIDKTPQYVVPYTDNDRANATEAEFGARTRPDTSRNTEMLSFIREHRVRQYLILDDWKFTNPELSRHQIQTDWSTGLTTAHLQQMYKILKGESL